MNLKRMTLLLAVGMALASSQAAATSLFKLPYRWDRGTPHYCDPQYCEKMRARGIYACCFGRPRCVPLPKITPRPVRVPYDY